MSENSQAETQPTKEQLLAMRVEALLFIATQPVSINQLASSLDVSAGRIEKTINLLQEQYKQRGIRIQEHQSRYQLTSAPEFAKDVEAFLDIELSARLSSAALEALAIIAYKQPVTRPGVDAIRGVNSDGVMKTLLSKGLIEELGRSDGPGRPILYGTTSDFLQYFGLETLQQLPDFEELNQEKQEESNPQKTVRFVY